MVTLNNGTWMMIIFFSELCSGDSNAGHKIWWTLKYPNPRQNVMPQLSKLSSCLQLGDEMGPLGTLLLAVSLHTSIWAILCQLLNTILQCYSEKWLSFNAILKHNCESMQMNHMASLIALESAPIWSSLTDDRASCTTLALKTPLAHQYNEDDHLWSHAVAYGCHWSSQVISATRTSTQLITLNMSAYRNQAWVSLGSEAE